MSEVLALEGSERPGPDGARDLGPLDASATVDVTLYLRSDPATTAPFNVAEEARVKPSQRRYLSADEARVSFGAAQKDIDAVLQFATANGLKQVRVNQAARSIKLSGSTAAIDKAFGVELHKVELNGAQFRTFDGQVKLPADLVPVVEAVLGLDDRPLGRQFMRRAPDDVQGAIREGRATQKQPANTYLPTQVAKLYDFPKQNASGQTVAVFAFNGPGMPGGYETSVLEQYFTKDLKLPMPEITDVVIQGPGNAPGDGSNPNDATPEVYLDLSIVGSLATGAKIVLYFTEFTEQGWVDALSQASTDTTNHPSVISISYGNPEDGAGSAWSKAAVKQVNEALEAAASRGMSITVAAGDSGAADGESSGVHVDFPASSPWVLACGGTRLESSGGKISKEVVWNDMTADGGGNGATGGGVSALFATPDWQSAAKVPGRVGTEKPGRGVPDVAALADPETPFIVAQPGGLGGVGGTSAAAPLWASLLARCNSALGKPVGLLNPTLYTMPVGTLRDITSGTNYAPGATGYKAGTGWDACTGLGCPGGESLLKAL
jgi:kumamolisin